MIFPPSAFVILFLDKMVNTILSCESFAGRRLLKQQPDKTVFDRFIRAYLKTQTSYINCTKSKNAVE